MIAKRALAGASGAGQGARRVCVAAAPVVEHHLGVNLRAWIFLGLLTGAAGPLACERPEPIDPGNAPEVCVTYVGCVKAVDADAGKQADAQYGPHGSCWEGTEDEKADCLSVCDVQLRSYADAFPELAACDASGIVTDAEFEIGAAVFDPVDPNALPVYKELGPGDPLTIVRGGQGLLMLPIGLHGRDFVITAEPNDWDNPKIPKVDLWIDIEGNNNGFGGHFAQLNNYAVGFVKLGDGMGTLEHMYIAVIVPDTVADPMTLTGLPGTIHVELRTYNQPAAIRELDFVVAPEILEY